MFLARSLALIALSAAQESEAPAAGVWGLSPRSGQSAKAEDLALPVTEAADDLRSILAAERAAGTGRTGTQPAG